MNEDEIFVGIQEATSTVCLNRAAIDALVKNLNLNCLDHFSMLAAKIAEENGQDLSKSWMLGTMNKEDCDYLTSFLLDKHDVVEFITK